MTKKNKTVLLGWDAADWKAINPLLEKGWMPNLKRLMDQGSYGPLATLDPPLSPTLWTSIATGKRPYKHGILGFTEPKEDGTGIQPVLSTNRKCKALWNIFTQNNLTSHIIGWWPSHPAEPIKGSMISNFYQKANKSTSEKRIQEWPLMANTIHPKDQEVDLAKLRVHPEELTGAILLPFIPNGEELDQEDPTIQNLLNNLRNIIADCCSIQSALTYQLQNKEWDFIGAYFDAIDHFGHGFMKFHPPQMDHIPDHLFHAFNNVVTAGYRFHDMMLGRVMDLVDDHTNIILISDHGFHPDHLRLKSMPRYPGAPALEHSLYGIIVGAGPDISKSNSIIGASLIDITPTILSIYDLPIGKDMDGKILKSFLKNTDNISWIDSWEQVAGEDGSHPELTKKNHAIDAAAMEQLIELGYVERPDPNAEVTIGRTNREIQFWLAKSLIDGEQYDEAIPILEKLFNDHPEQSRYGEVLSFALNKNGKTEESGRVLSLLKANNEYDRPNQLLLNAKDHLVQERYYDALQNLYELKEIIPDSVDVYLFLGKTFLALSEYDKAHSNFKTALEIDYQNYFAMNGLGSAHYLDGKYTEALEHFSNSLSLQYNQSAIHRTVADCLYKIGDIENAQKALSQADILSKANQKDENLDVEITDKSGTISNKEAKELIIVSGLPRSGTSMIMQLLHANDIPIFTDELRLADESNPKGYYEHRDIMNMAKSKEFLQRVSSGTALKVIAQLLPLLPLNMNYKIIFIQRPMDEILLSQKKMIHRLHNDKSEESVERSMDLLSKSFAQALQKVNSWAQSMTNVEILKVDFHDTINNPEATFADIEGFLDIELNRIKLAGVVDSTLYRTKR